MNKSKALYGQIRISTKFRQSWRGFTLQQGHMFGEDEQGYFVSAACPGRFHNSILVYRCAKNETVWRLVSESTMTETAQKILKVAQNKRPKKVSYGPLEVQAGRLCKQSQKRSFTRYNPTPPVVKPQKTWIDEICQKWEAAQ